MGKLRKESIRQEQKKHLLQQIEMRLKRMLVTVPLVVWLSVKDLKQNWTRPEIVTDHGTG